MVAKGPKWDTGGTQNFKRPEHSGKNESAHLRLNHGESYASLFRMALDYAPRQNHNPQVRGSNP